MELSFGTCEAIVKTLPIGFYAGRRIEMELSRTEETSYYDPMNDKIVVSYPIIAQGLEKSNRSDEEGVRSMLYHEVSHAILTPADELHNSFQLNVFEDERIETVLRDYYHGVNFKQQLFDICGGYPPKASDAKSAYYNAVRFGLGTAKVQQKILDILQKYAKLNRSSRRWDHDKCNPSNYEWEIDDLWRMIQREYDAHPEEFQPQSMSGDEDDDGEGASMMKGEPQEGETIHECVLTKEEIKKMVGACLSNHPNLDDAQVEKLQDFQKMAELIIGNFRKKNGGGSGINTYSGVFNPRAVARKDYRYFERSVTTHGNNKFGTCHLNLIIDTSGSFYDNVPLVNGILSILSEIERKNRNFSMDVAFINDEFRLCKTVRERKMVADGGNAIPVNMRDILAKLQKPQTCNYNIILFDGDAICQGRDRGDPCKQFRVFDMKQTTLITDPENEEYMKPAFASTKVVVTQQYTQELIDHILRALTIAFG